MVSKSFRSGESAASEGRAEPANVAQKQQGVVNLLHPGCLAVLLKSALLDPLAEPRHEQKD